MKTLEVRNVEIRPDSIQEAIEELEKAIAKHSKMKDLLEQLLAVSSGRSPAKGAPRGRKPAGAPRAQRGRPGPGGRKTLRVAIEEVLRAAGGGPVKPVDLRNLVRASDYPTTATPQSLYTAVFNTAKQMPNVSKTAAGFSLKASAMRKAAPAAGKKTSAGAKKAKRTTGRAKKSKARKTKK